MVGEATQRFAIFLVLFAGFLVTFGPDSVRRVGVLLALISAFLCVIGFIAEIVQWRTRS